ncbi:MAG: hypothetical protein H7A23_17485 [Leptospiraceae bacterium]|nr:hypothetical protein [Leptospiraceae bacterium]
MMENKENITALCNRAKEMLDGTEIDSNPKLKALLEDTIHLLTDILLESERKYRLLAENEVEKANQTKADFIANISHQIQTPLNIILGFTELLKEKLENHSQYDEYFSGILSSGKSLLHLIDNILDFSKAESGQLVIKEYPMSVYSYRKVRFSGIKPIPKTLRPCSGQVPAMATKDFP